MKLKPHDSRNALTALRLLVTTAAAALLPLLLHGSAPSWWMQRGVLTENTGPDDYAPANQGQLKNIARAAVDEMDAKLTGGAEDELHALVAGWSMPGAMTNDFAPLALGQLKQVATPFYDRLIAAGITDDYPWNRSVNPPDDFAVANLGQIKQLFSFAIPPANQFDRDNGDRIAAGQNAANLALEPHAVWVWADRFGNGTDFDRNYPRRLAELSGVSSITAGERHLALLHGDGTVWTWGENAVGQLGDGTNLDRAAPEPVPGLPVVTAVRAGGLHNLALLHDGSLMAWGDNYYGQLGTGDTVSASAPRSRRARMNRTTRTSSVSGPIIT